MKKYIKIFSAALCAASMVAVPACSDDEPDYSYWLDDDEGTEVKVQSMTKSVKIDPTQTYQVLEGIGASDCWLPATLGRYWTSGRDRMAQWLFSQEIRNGQPQGIGLSMWRVNLGGGTEELGSDSGIDDDNKYNRAPSYVSGSAGNLSYDWNKCPGQRYFMEKAKAAGVDKFVLFSNTPLVQFTRNGKGVSSSGGLANLKDDCYDDFADYMATVAHHFVGEGYNISHISPANEPQYNWDGSNQEGSGWQNTQLAKIARELEKSLDAKGIDTKISLGEAGSWGCLYEGNSDRENVLARFFEPSSSAYIGDLKRLDNICGHSYWSDGTWNGMIDVRQSTADAAAKYGVKLWQTEWSMLAAADNHYGEHLTANTSYMDIALWMSAIIHNDFTVTGVTSWSYWTAMSVERFGQKDRFMLINCIPAGGNNSNDFTKEGKVEDFRTLWVLGNYSLFIRPGFQRIDMKMITSEKFFGNAWISPDGKQVVCVYTNRQEDRSVKVKLDTNTWNPDVESVWVYTTSENKNLEGKQIAADEKAVCDPLSVTTVVYNLK